MLVTGRLALGFLLTFMLLMAEEPQLAQQNQLSLSERLESMQQQELQNEKLRQEIIKLRLETERQTGFWQLLPSYATFITALVAVVGILATIWKQINERSKDRKQREDDSRRRLDEKFASVVADLGSKSQSLQASAAVSIITFLRSEYSEYHNQVFMILLANLKIKHHEAINKLLIDAFEKAIRIRLQSAAEKREHVEIDLSSTDLYRIDLSSLNLCNIDLGFAQMQHANLTHATLRRARGWGVNLDNARLSRANLEEARLKKGHFQEAQFHEARLVAAILKEAILLNAKFHQAEMQSAHLEKATLVGAQFQEANLNDTYFCGAVLDEVALRSIINAKNWRLAHFDDDVQKRLDILAKNGSRGAKE